MGKTTGDGEVQVIDGKKKPFCRKTCCYKFTLFIVAVILASLVISCVVVVVLRGHLLPPETVPVQVGNLELMVQKDVHTHLMEYYDQIDVGRNGSVTLELMLDHFDSMDSNNDRVLICTEVTSEMGEQYRFIFEAEDLDNDSAIRRSQVGDIHNRVDIDDDGIISREEFALYHDLARRAKYDRKSL